MAKRKHQRVTNGGTKLDQDRIEAAVAQGGLAVYEPDGALFHLAPPDVANALRFLLSRLQQSDGLGAHQTIAVTSALEGEGVTTVARSLAAVVAHDLDRKVCLVETDWWLPGTDGGNVPIRRTGFADVLRGTCSIDDALLRTSDPRLAVLVPGELPVAARPATVASDAFNDALTMLTKTFDTVLIDTPPVLKASEGITIARRADAAVLVVRQGVTTERQVELAVEELGGAELLGVVLNRSSTRVPKFLQRFTVPA